MPRPKKRRGPRLPGGVRDESRPGRPFLEGEVEIRIEFDLNIEEGNTPITDESLDEIEQEARVILEEGGKDIEETARGLAPVKTGALAMSIYFEVEDVTGLIVGATVPYAAFQEYGTIHIEPRRFLQKAIDEHQPMIQEDLDQMIADHLSEDMSEDDPELEFNVEMESVGEQ